MHLSWEDRLLLLDAILWLAIARFVIAVAPFRHVGSLAALPARQPNAPTDIQLIEIRRIRWAVLATSREVPWRAKCFEQGLAAQYMLRRRGVPSVLYYGATQDNQRGLYAHVWVRACDVDVIGGETANRFAILATFPPQKSEPLTESP
jgi:Transglutaminase-like superfamily